MSRYQRRIWLRPGIASGLLGAVLLNGCATLGGNVKGSFSCAAPDGICAPSSSIDDRALAMISGDDATADSPPAIRSTSHSSGHKPQLFRGSGQRILVPQAPLGRTQERVLKIVVRPYIDDRGWLHDLSTVHAVVLPSQWQEPALAFPTQTPDGRPADTALSLSDAVDRADPVGASLTGIDPNLPDEAVVATARARAADPVSAIRADVAARLAATRPARPPREAAAPGSASVPDARAPDKAVVQPIIRATGFPAGSDD